MYTLAVTNEPFLAIFGEGRMNWPSSLRLSLCPFLVLNSVNKGRPQSYHLSHFKQITIRRCEAIVVGERAPNNLTILGGTLSVLQIVGSHFWP